MQQKELINLLTEKDFHIDPLGRVVIDNPEILAAINGAMNTSTLSEVFLNGGCSNSGCH